MERFLDVLFEDGSVLQKEPDTYLFHAGDPVRFVHLVEDGAVHLERTQIIGQVMCFQRARHGDVLAEASIYAEAYHCDARIVEPTRLRRLCVDRLVKRLETVPELTRAWQARLARTVQTTRLLAEIRGLKTVAQRLDAWLDQNGALPSKGQWQDLAQVLAVSPEALYREIARRRALKASKEVD
ncbi:Crp/Fnr family transcriptional regulator [Cognatishimia sp. F0-27]|uniref:Crp/Fnr family transcriptional regulator n=1 Tax=Cognatishimia sp. F0-27 TaxID=2816855 RepID=UPI001D0C40DC|nr:Crp/Fnr family transcriptional regulator [Cognatishimia sp. F0-27]MCC1492810.1 Crp/Fnr family transcriptional regulator [Cognatishimia sp. F0-27]